MKLIEWEVNEDSYQEQIVIPEAHQLYLPTEIQKMLEGAGSIRIQLV